MIVIEKKESIVQIKKYFKEQEFEKIFLKSIELNCYFDQIMRGHISFMLEYFI